ncbi:MAG TPA: hypothetical protein VHM01_03725, partial [Alphaproteobacteria bacterium]|nr:hypothetical protein [Alphaproteobacteria bacterium]
MDESALKSILQTEQAAAMGDSAASDLASQRAQAMDYYLGDMAEDMPAAPGRSRAVSTDVADTVDGIMPSLIDIFMASDEVARFNPVGPEDEEAAKQETDYVNHVFYQENRGFVVLHSMIKDALIQKNGIVKFWWEEGEKEERETYQNLPDDAFALLVADDGIELIEHTVRPDPSYAVPEAAEAAPQLHDAVVIRRKPYGCVRVVAVPPEEFLISKRARSIEEARYCAHKVKRSVSELIAAGYPRDVVENLPAGTSSATDEAQARATVDDNDEEDGFDTNRAMRLVEVTEHYIRVDWDGDGIAELRKVTTAGSGAEILDNEPIDMMPFAGITPILMSHRFWGRSVADLVMDIQRIKTALIRALLDNAYFANNQRMEVSESHANDHTLDDLLTNRPGGIVRTKMPGGLLPIPTNPIGGHIFPVLEYMDTTREVRTGVTRLAVGPDPNTLNPYSTTATGANLLANAAQQRIRLIARTFAETGIKDLFVGIHALILKHGKAARIVRLRDQWVTVDPRAWKTRKDMTVLVGLGTGTRDQVQNYLTTILQMQIRALEMQGGAAGPLVTLSNIYNTLRKLTENAGFTSADPFFTAPGAAMPQAGPPQPDPQMVEAANRMQMERMKAEADA